MKKHVKIFTVLLMAILMINLVGCTKTEEIKKEDTTKVEEKIVEKAEKIEKTSYPLTITDSDGDQIVLKEEPKKIVSVGPNVTEIIYAVGKGDKLIGRTDYCDYPEEVKSLPSIGTLKNINIESVAALEPDLIIGSTHFSAENKQKLKELGIPVALIYAPESFESVYDIITKTGQMLNANEEAAKVVNGMKETVNVVKEAVKDEEKPSVYYVVAFGEGGDYTATGETFIGEMIEMAGAQNVAKDTEGWAYSLEKLVEKDPEIIILSKYFETKKAFTENENYKQLTAVKEDRVYEIDNNKIVRQAPRVSEGLLEMAKILHPDSFKE